jgi:hypothetical protein
VCECVGRHHCWVAGPLGLGPIRVRLSLYIVPILYAIQQFTLQHGIRLGSVRFSFLPQQPAALSQQPPPTPAVAAPGRLILPSRGRPHLQPLPPPLPPPHSAPAALALAQARATQRGAATAQAGSTASGCPARGLGQARRCGQPRVRPDFPCGGAAPRRSGAAGPSHSMAARPRRRLVSGGPAAHNHTGARHCRPHPACTRVSRRPSARSPLSPWRRFSTGPPPALPARPPMVLRRLGSPACAPSGGAAAAAVAGLTCLRPSSALQRRSPPPSRQPELFLAPLPCVGVFARAAPCHRASHLLIARVDAPAAPPT